MGLLDKLWDDTVAGPRPDSGLGRLRKQSKLSIRTDLSNDEAFSAVAEEQPKVTRSITIRKPSGSPTSSGTPPESPAGASTPPASPFYGSSGRKEWSRFRRRSMSDAFERRGGGRGGGFPAAGVSVQTTPKGKAVGPSDPLPFEE